jgi:hypothetical protein
VKAEKPTPDLEPTDRPADGLDFTPQSHKSTDSLYNKLLNECLNLEESLRSHQEMLTIGPNSSKKDQFQSANNDELIKTEIKRETSWEDRNY